jgi:hypothetical protein
MHGHNFYNRMGVQRNKDGNRLGLGVRGSIYALTIQTAPPPLDGHKAPVEPLKSASRATAIASTSEPLPRQTGMDLFLSSKFANQP